MKMIQISICTAPFVESHITSGAPSKSTFIAIMVMHLSISPRPGATDVGITERFSLNLKTWGGKFDL